MFLEKTFVFRDYGCHVDGDGVKIYTLYRYMTALVYPYLKTSTENMSLRAEMTAD